MPDARFIEFEIIKEPWNKYQISDGSVLKTRIILTEAERVMVPSPSSAQIPGRC